MKLTLIFEAWKAISELIGKPTPKVGEKILQGANAAKKIGHALNIGAIVGTVGLSAIGMADLDALYSWYEKDKLFFFIVLTVMQAPYIISSYMKLAGKVQAEADPAQ